VEKERKMEEIYTPQYGDELVLKRGHVLKMLTWTRGIIQGRYQDYWKWYAWSDTEDFIRERIHDMGLVKVGNWGTPDLPEIVGYYREVR
jgi:hypothetical protein